MTGTTIKWAKARCPICGREYKYPESGYKPSTCGSFNCIHKHLHPELYNQKLRGGDIS